MSVYRGIGELRLKLPEQGKQSLFLLWCARILMSLAIGGLSTDVADANAMCIMPLAVGANLLDGAARVDATVTIDYVVVAYRAIAFGLVPSRNVGHSIVATFRRVGTVDDDFRYATHNN